MDIGLCGVLHSSADVVGAKNVSITVADRTTPTVFYDVENLVALCPNGYYGMWGENCTKCRMGALCPGGETFADLVTSLPGYWRQNVTVPNSACSSMTFDRAQCPIFLGCSPADACTGSNKCAIGYRTCTRRVVLLP